MATVLLTNAGISRIFRQLKTKRQIIHSDSHFNVYVLSFLQGNTVLLKQPLSVEGAKHFAIKILSFIRKTKP